MIALPLPAVDLKRDSLRPARELDCISGRSEPSFISSSCLLGREWARCFCECGLASPGSAHATGSLSFFFFSHLSDQVRSGRKLIDGLHYQGDIQASDCRFIRVALITGDYSRQSLPASTEQKHLLMSPSLDKRRPLLTDEDGS